MNADAINPAINCYVTRLQRQDFDPSHHNILKDVLVTEASPPAPFICYCLCFLQFLTVGLAKNRHQGVSVSHFWQVWSKTDFTINALTTSNPNHEHWVTRGFCHDTALLYPNPQLFQALAGTSCIKSLSSDVGTLSQSWCSIPHLCASP